MRVVLGFKAHSGWAALVAVGMDGKACEVHARCRVELIENRWAGAPYHAAQGMPLARAGNIVAEALAEVRRVTTRRLRAVFDDLRRGGHEVVACAVLTPAPMPAWTVEQILSVHVRMHKAEGVMFPEALLQAAGDCGVRAVAIAPNDLPARAGAWRERIARLGESLGPPWGADQKNAALAALIVLRESCAN